MKRRNNTTHHSSKIKGKKQICSPCKKKQHVKCTSNNCRCGFCSRINWR